MAKALKVNRRRFFGAAAMSIAATQLGTFTSAKAQTADPQTADLGTQSSAAHTSFATLKQIDAGLLNIGYAEAGPSSGYPVFCCTVGRTTSTVLSTSLRYWLRRATE